MKKLSVSVVNQAVRNPIHRIANIAGVDEKEVRRVYEEAYKSASSIFKPGDHGTETFYRAVINMVKNKLGITNNEDPDTPLTSISNINYKLHSNVLGFNLETARQYLLKLGYNDQFLADFKEIRSINDIKKPYPPHLKSEYMPKFISHLRRSVRKLEDNERKGSSVDFPIVEFAKIVGSFVKYLMDKKLQPYVEELETKILDQSRIENDLV